MDRYSIVSHIGNTPMLRLSKLSAPYPATLFAKCEYFNPSGSIKDRVVHYMLDQASQKGLINANTTLIEATSGNTGASLAMLGALNGCAVIVTTPAKTSHEKIAIMKSFGADVHVCPTNLSPDDPGHYIILAKQLAKEISNAYLLNQYNDHSNVAAHYGSTGPEIWQQMEGKIDYLVCCASSGGTISGVGRYLKEKNPKIKIILADPVGSALTDYYHTKTIKQQNIKSYRVEGAGKDVVCDCMNFSIIDDVIPFTDDDAFNQAKILAKAEGILAGGSSGGALFAALKIAREISHQGNIAVILPDSGMKYLTTMYSI